MSSDIKNISLYIDNMTCANCEYTIERALVKIAGIEQVKASYTSGSVDISYRPDIIEPDKIIELIEAHDYHVKTDKSTDKAKRSVGDAGKTGAKKDMDFTDIIGLGIIIFTLYMILRRFGLNDIFNSFPLAGEGMGYGMLFIIGALTSVHCVAMCGGICLSQCAVKEEGSKEKSGRLAVMLPSLLYNSGRVIAYTVVGGAVGALGSVISFSGTMRGIVQIIAGLFMVIMGLNMLNIFPSLKRFTPRLPKGLTGRIYKQREQQSSPLIIGLLNGLMPCGPLQAMQLYALSTGNPLKGAFSMFLFSVGTFPLMFAFGALSALLSKKFTGQMMKAAAALVLVLGISMFSSGAALSGVPLPFLSGNGSQSKNINIARLENGIQIVQSGISSGSYEPIIVQKGIPVRWIIQAEQGEINGCNNSIIAPGLNISRDLSVGDTVVEFTPESSGTFPFSCWMGMIRSQIKVVDDINNIND
jgi:sulfite exporter TauE/SafE/copper chaperone CopZ